MVREGEYEIRTEEKDIDKYRLGRDVAPPTSSPAPPYYGFGGFAPNTHFWQPSLDPETDDS
jgi:hypothetical protein